ncbi:hypothetical protein ACSFBI_05180 [Variovorax sp. RB3P1]|uniref:hypothetical protein n=1 Tax=Variovorax sp. RB3P1 TaxID=3443732 RepID=UPI003F487E55
MDAPKENNTANTLTTLETLFGYFFVFIILPLIMGAMVLYLHVIGVCIGNLLYANKGYCSTSSITFLKNDVVNKVEEIKFRFTPEEPDEPDVDLQKFLDNAPVILKTTGKISKEDAKFLAELSGVPARKIEAINDDEALQDHLLKERAASRSNPENLSANGSLTADALFAIWDKNETKVKLKVALL